MHGLSCVILLLGIAVAPRPIIILLWAKTALSIIVLLWAITVLSIIVLLRAIVLAIIPGLSAVIYARIPCSFCHDLYSS